MPLIMSVIPCSLLILVYLKVRYFLLCCFLLFINNIPDDISVNIRLHADDCVLCNEVACVDNQIRPNDDLNKIFMWCNTWQMCVNYEKVSVCQ